MSDTAFLSVALFFTALGYTFAKLQTELRKMSERQQREQAARQAFIDAHRPRFHPNELVNIQERAELDDLRDYIRRGDA